MGARLGHVTIDTVDLPRTVAFWTAVLDGRVWTAPDGTIAVVSAADSPDVMIQLVDRTTPGKNPVHLDLFTATLDGEIERLVALGATLVRHHEGYGTRWATMNDPDGYVFDVVQHD